MWRARENLDKNRSNTHTQRQEKKLDYELWQVTLTVKKKQHGDDENQKIHSINITSGLEKKNSAIENREP